MRRLLVFLLAVAFCGSAASAVDLNVTVTSGGASEVTVDPGASVPYEVTGELSNDPNGGLALVGLDLCFTGGALDPTQVNVPDTPPMNNFVSDEGAMIYEGISNPRGPCPPACGYAGTLINDCLVQIGGGQNTIKNTTEYADFPIGTVIENVAIFGSPQEFVTGTLTAPTEEGTYYLNLSNLFANVIQDGQTGEPFWASEAAEAGTIGNLTVIVSSAVVNLVSTVPVHDESLPRSAKNIVRYTFDGLLPSAPAAGEIMIQELLDGGAFGADLSADFTCTINGVELTCVEDTPVLSHATWYGIRNIGGWTGVGAFEVHHLVLVGDATNDNNVLFNDLSEINTGVPTFGAADDDRRDINGDSNILFNDLSVANANVPTFGPGKPSGH